jgi:hypothetical protein
MFASAATSIHRRQAAFRDELNDQLPVRNNLTYVAYDDRVRPVLVNFAEYALIFGRCGLLDQHIGQRDFQYSARLSKLFLNLLSGSVRTRSSLPGSSSISSCDHGIS